MMRAGPMLSFLRSKTLSVWLFGGFAAYYLTVAVWSQEAFSRFIALVSTNTLFRALYLLFLINLSCRMLPALRTLWSRKSRFFLRLPLAAGILLFLFSFFMSLNLREHQWLLRGEGDPVELPWERSAYRVATVQSALERRQLQTGESLVFDYEPSIELTDQLGAGHRVGAFPPRRVGSSWMHVLNFGIGPGLELRKQGTTVFAGYMALRLLPFGEVDHFTIEPWPYTFYLSILPNRVITRGQESGREYDLARPLYHVEIVKEERKILQAESGGEVAFDGDMSLLFIQPEDWVLLEATSDPFYLWYIASLGLLLAGIVLYPLSLLVPPRSAGG